MLKKYASHGFAFLTSQHSQLYRYQHVKVNKYVTPPPWSHHIPTLHNLIYINKKNMCILLYTCDPKLKHFLAKFQFTLLLSFQSNWTFRRRKLYRIVIYHVNGCFIQYLWIKIFNLGTLCLIWNTFFFIVSYLKYFTNKFHILFTST